MTDNRLDLDAIEKYCSEATEGPWGGEVGVVRSENKASWNEDVLRSFKNIDFIASARTDLPAVVAYARRLEEIIEIAIHALKENGFGESAELLREKINNV